MFDSNFLHWWCQRALSHTRSWGRAEEGVKESCLHSITSECFLWPHCIALSVWRQDWPWEQGTALSSRAAEVLMPVAALWAAPVEGKLVRAAACNSLILMVFGGFLCALVNMFLECSVKKSHLSNLNPVKKEFTCCLHLAGGALNSGGNQDVILFSP